MTIAEALRIVKTQTIPSLGRSGGNGHVEALTVLIEHMEGGGDMDNYHLRAGETAIYPPQSAVVYPILGLASEAGELAGKLKKVLRDSGGDLTSQRDAMVDELGDVLWYVSAVARDLGFRLSTVASRNLQKLSDRAARGVIGGSGDKR